METVITKYLGDFRTEAEHVASGAKIITDANNDKNIKPEFISPPDMLVASYGCCALTVMGIAAQSHGFDINGAEVKITKVMGKNPYRIVELVAEYTFPHNRYSDKERKIIELSARQCPVANSLDPALKITNTVVYND